jgi:hypothetical protein
MASDGVLRLRYTSGDKVNRISWDAEERGVKHLQVAARTLEGVAAPADAFALSLLQVSRVLKEQGGILIEQKCNVAQPRELWRRGRAALDRTPVLCVDAGLRGSPANG